MTLTGVFLACGIAASLLFIGMDLVASAFLYPGYDFTSQQVSELSAIGAPSRDFWLAMGFPYAVLSLLMAIGVWRAAAGRTSLKVCGTLIGLFTLNGLLWGLVAPMHMRGTEFTGTDTMHISFAGSAVLLMLTFMVSGAAAMGRAFRICTGLTVVAMLVAGATVSTAIPAIAADQATPWMGLVERISVYSPMVWLTVLALGLMTERQLP
ncbi:MAG: DUF998 domain-containing protein [Mesorhizobium sp.]|nr:DUF998 domain-containing protein [Mesorhizobium sp.]